MNYSTHAMTVVIIKADPPIKFSTYSKTLLIDHLAFPTRKLKLNQVTPNCHSKKVFKTKSELLANL